MNRFSVLGNRTNRPLASDSEAYIRRGREFQILALTVWEEE